MNALVNDIARRRKLLGLTQSQVAERAGLSRQSLNTLESARTAPSTAVALRLARTLGCTVDELFWLRESTTRIQAEVADTDAPASGRAVVASIAGRWVAHRLPSDELSSVFTSADAVLKPGRRASDPGQTPVELLARPEDAARTLVCAGCAPALGILAARASGGVSASRVVWLDRPSLASLDLLRRGLVHIAGAHLFDEAQSEFNVPDVKRLFPGRSMLVVNLVRWTAGILVAAGNPKGIHGAHDLLREGLTVVQRAPGAAAQRLLERIVRGAGSDVSKTRGPTARTHLDAARLVSMGLADAGIAVESAARAFGLELIPMAEERFDLVVAQELSADPRVDRLINLASSRAFRVDAEGLGGLSARRAGTVIARTAA